MTHCRERKRLIEQSLADHFSATGAADPAFSSGASPRRRHHADPRAARSTRLRAYRCSSVRRSSRRRSAALPSAACASRALAARPDQLGDQGAALHVAFDSARIERLLEFIAPSTSPTRRPQPPRFRPRCAAECWAPRGCGCACAERLIDGTAPEKAASCQNSAISARSLGACRIALATKS